MHDASAENASGSQDRTADRATAPAAPAPDDEPSKKMSVEYVAQLLENGYPPKAAAEHLRKLAAAPQPQGEASPVASDLSAFRQGNWEHPDRNGRIVGWVIPDEAVERMGADAFCLPREIDDALTNLAAAHGIGSAIPSEPADSAGTTPDAVRWNPEPPCWLVEKRKDGAPVGFLGYELGTFEWFPTADKATRFVRRQDANGVAECFEFEDVIVAEHIWG